VDFMDSAPGVLAHTGGFLFVQVLIDDPPY